MGRTPGPQPAFTSGEERQARRAHCRQLRPVPQRTPPCLGPLGALGQLLEGVSRPTGEHEDPACLRERGGWGHLAQQPRHPAGLWPPSHMGPRGSPFTPPQPTKRARVGWSPAQGHTGGRAGPGTASCPSASPGVGQAATQLCGEAENACGLWRPGGKWQYVSEGLWYEPPSGRGPD